MFAIGGVKVGGFVSALPPTPDQCFFTPRFAARDCCFNSRFNHGFQNIASSQCRMTIRIAETDVVGNILATYVQSESAGDAEARVDVIVR